MFDDLDAGHIELECHCSCSDAHFSFGTGNVTARCVLFVVRQLSCLETVFYVAHVLPDKEGHLSRQWRFARRSIRHYTPVSVCLDA